MTKKLRKLAMFAVLSVAVGAAPLTSCGKDDEVINYVPAMEMKNGVKHRLKVHPYFIFWRCWEELAPSSNVITIRRCVCDQSLYDPYQPLPEICAVSVNMPDPDVAVAHMETTDGRIDRLVLYSSAMEDNLKNMLLDFVGIGKITFSVDCPITDPASLEVLNQNSIPAGEYSIIMDGEDFVIIIAE
jgi:hypothetical protein